MLASSLSAANFFFWATSNYFDAPSADKPLLHTWSLAVEEQFYILFPIFIVLVSRYLQKYFRTVVVVVAIASFAWSVIDLRIDPGAAFYLPFTRAWELLAGTILALGIIPVPGSRILREVLAFSGLAGIFWLMFTLSQNKPFPGEHAFLPCTAAGAIILAGQTGTTLTGRVLSWRPAVFIGLISYSLYLWHWPLWVFTKIAILPASIVLPQSGITLILFVISIIIAAISWRFVETPFRKGLRRPGKRAVFAFGATCILAFSLSSLILASTHGLTGRFPAAVDTVGDYLDYGHSHPAETEALFRSGSCFLDRREPVADFDERRCLAPVQGKRQVLIFGDSHAANLQHGLEASVPNVHFDQATSSACPPILQQVVTSTVECQQFVQKVLHDYIPESSVTEVLLNADWQPTQLNDLTNTIELLRRNKIGIVVFGPLPKYDNALPRLLAAQIKNGDAGFVDQHRDRSTKSIDATMKRMAMETWHVPYISLLEILCPDDKCSEFAASGIPLQFDGAHLTLQGSDYVGREVNLHFPHLFDSKQEARQLSPIGPHPPTTIPTASAELPTTSINARFFSFKNPASTALSKNASSPSQYPTVFTKTTGFECSRNCAHVTTSSSSSRVPYPPGSTRNPSASAAIRAFRSCIVETSSSRVNPPCEISFPASTSGSTPITSAPPASAAFATAPINPTLAPPYTNPSPAAAIAVPSA